MILQMGGPADYDIQFVSVRLSRKFIYRNGGMLLKPLLGLHLFKPVPKSATLLTPESPQFRCRVYLDSGVIRADKKRFVQPRKHPSAHIQQLEHLIVHGNQMTQEVNSSIPARCNLPVQLLIGQSIQVSVQVCDGAIPPVKHHFHK